MGTSEWSGKSQQANRFLVRSIESTEQQLSSSSSVSHPVSSVLSLLIFASVISLMTTATSSFLGHAEYMSRGHCRVGCLLLAAAAGSDDCGLEVLVGGGSQEARL